MKQGHNTVYKNPTEGYAGFKGLGLIAQQGGLSTYDINFLDIKNLNDIADENKQKIKRMIADMRSAKAAQKHYESIVHSTYGKYDLAFMRLQIAERWAIYRAARADSSILTAEYMRRLSADSWGVSHTEIKRAA